MAKRKPLLELAGDRPHRARTHAADPRKRLVRHAITERVGAMVRVVAECWRAEAADHVELLAPLLSEDQLATARWLHRLWAKVERRITGGYGEPVRGHDDRSEAGPEARDVLNRTLREMGLWRSAEVVAVVCCGEPQRPDGTPRSIELVREGLDLARRWRRDGDG